MTVTNSKNYPAPRPTRMTLFLRSCLIWQMFRFVVINLRMTIMIVKSHGRRLDPQKLNKDSFADL